MPTATLLPAYTNTSGGGSGGGGYTLTGASTLQANGSGTGVFNNNPYNSGIYGSWTLNAQTITYYAYSNNGYNFLGYPANWAVSDQTGISVEYDYSVTGLADDTITLDFALYSGSTPSGTVSDAVTTTINLANTSGVQSASASFGTLSATAAADWIGQNVNLQFTHGNTRSMGADAYVFRLYAVRVIVPYTPLSLPYAGIQVTRPAINRAANW